MVFVFVLNLIFSTFMLKLKHLGYETINSILINYYARICQLRERYDRGQR